MEKEATDLRLELNLRSVNNVRIWHRAAVAALTVLDFNRFRDL